MKNQTRNFFLLLFFCTSLLSFSQVDEGMTLLKDDDSSLIKFENHYFEALKYKAIGNFTRAITELEKCQQLFPDDTSVVFELSKNYFSLNKFVEATLYIEKALENDSDNYWFLAHAKKVFLKQYDYAKAIDFQKKMVLKRPEKKEDLVLIYIQAKKYKEAKKIAEELTIKGLVSSKLEYYKQIISNNINQKTAVKAIEKPKVNVKNTSLVELKKAFESNQKFTVLKEIVTQEFTNSNFENLMIYSSKGLELFPAQPFVYLMNAKGLIQAKNYNDAIEVLNNGIDFVVDDIKLEIGFYEQFAICFDALNQEKEAKKYLDKVNRLKKNK